MRQIVVILALLLAATTSAFAQQSTPNQVNGCVYLTTLPTLINGQSTVFHCDANGKLLTTGSGGITTITANSTATSGFTAGQLIYSDGSKAQASGATTDGAGNLIAHSLALGGATLGTNTLASTGTALISGGLTTGTSTGTTYSQPGLTILNPGAPGPDLITSYYGRFRLLGASGTAFDLSFYQNDISMPSEESFCWGASPGIEADDTCLTRRSPAFFNLGRSDAPSPVAQSLGVQSVIAGTSNTAGALFGIYDSGGTGTGASGGFTFYTHPLGGSGTARNAAVAALSLSSAGLLALPQISSDAGFTDATVCEDTTLHGLYAGSGTLGICLGTSSARYKHNITNLTEGIATIEALKPKRYYLNSDHGDPTKPFYGFVAEDCINAVPELTGVDASGRPNTCDYLGMVPILVKAAQEMQAEIADLRSKLH